MQDTIREMSRAEKRAAIVRAEANRRDMVNKPPHYNSSAIECIDAMEAMSEGAKVAPHAAYCWQNAFKYLWRWPYKNGLEDLKKCRWYLDRLIEELEE